MLKAGEGTHLLVEMAGCQSSIMTSEEELKRALDSLPALIGMTLILPTITKYCDAKDSIDSGISGVNILAESHISCHLFPERQFLYLDIFSCRTFNTEQTMDFLKEIFKPKETEFSVIKRGKLFGKYVK